MTSDDIRRQKLIIFSLVPVSTVSKGIFFAHEKKLRLAHTRRSQAYIISNFNEPSTLEKSMSSTTQGIIDGLRTELPPLVSRREAARLGRWSVGTLANKDCDGTGPERIIVGGRTVYPRESFLEWFEKQIGPAKTGKVAG